jgi:hypothetical protein
MTIMPLHFVPAPISFDQQSGAFSVTANDGAGTIEVMIERGALEKLAGEKLLTKDAALTALVKNQTSLIALATRLYERRPSDRRVVIAPRDLESEPR